MHSRLAWSALLSSITAAGLVFKDALWSAHDVTFLCVPDPTHGPWDGVSSLPAFVLGLLAGALVAFPPCLLWLRWARPLEGESPAATCCSSNPPGRGEL